MAPRIEQRQQAQVAHRLNFWGTPSAGNTVSWKYQGQAWLVKRPDDGDLPLERIVQCKECKKTLTYSVLSVKAALARQRRWRICAYSGLALLVPGLLGLIFFHGAGTASIAISRAARGQRGAKHRSSGACPTKSHGRPSQESGGRAVIRAVFIGRSCASGPRCGGRPRRG